MNTLYLHIGTQKTATTTLQHFLAENDDILKTKGYTYPLFPECFYPYWDNRRNGLFIGHPYFNKYNERDRDKEKEFYDKGMKRLHEIFLSYPNVILSEERLWLQLFYDKGSLMKRLLEDGKEHGYQIRLIVYLRRQDIFAESYWNQQVKSTISETRSAAGFINEFEHINYYYVLKVISDVIGEDNLTVLRFDDAVNNDGIIADFMKRIGLELTDEYNINQEHTNSRLSANTAEIKRIINQIDSLRIGDQIYLKERVNMVSEISDRKYRRSVLSEEERASFMEKFREGNDLAAKLYINDGRPLFSEDYSGLPKWDKDNPEYLDDVILTSAAGDVLLYRRIKEAEKTIIKQQDQIKKLESELKKLTKRMDHLRHPIRTLAGKIKN